MNVAILAGGIGSRLWPISNPETPKPLIKIFNNKSLIRQTIDRIYSLKIVKNIVIVTNIKLVKKIKQEIKDYIINKNYKFNITVVAEPEGKDTAAATILASFIISKFFNPKGILLFLPIDHFIADLKLFKNSIYKAISLSCSGKIVNIGIEPHSPITEYGYIKYKNKKVIKFTEKPNVKDSINYINQGDYLWNTGIFCTRVDVFLTEVIKYCYGILKNIKNSISHLDKCFFGRYNEIYLDKKYFGKILPISIDYSLMEKTKKLYVVKSTMRWYDIGTWDSVVKFSNVKKDIFGNQIIGDVVNYESQNCYVENKDKLVAVIGVKNLIVVNHERGILITNKEKSSKVKNVYKDIVNYKNKNNVI